MKIFPVVSLLFSAFCFGFLCVIAGVWLNQVGRTPVIERGINSAYALAYQTYNQYIKPDTYAAKNYFWLPQRYSEKGVVPHRPDKVSGEYTLLLSAHQQGASLLDISGNIVHEWLFDYSPFLPDSLASRWSAPERFIYWWQAKVYANGDILALLNFDNSSPAGLALIKLDKHGEMLWQYQANVHHDFSEDEQGNIYVLEQSIQHEQQEGLEFLPKPYLDEWVTVLDRDGQLKQRINLFSAIAKSPYRKVLRRIHKSLTGDYLHPNAVTFISDELASKADYLRPNSILVDVRDLDAVMAIDLGAEEVYWMVRGPWFFQHDSDILDNGNLLLFDNLSLGKRSRVIEFDPRRQALVWEYQGSDDKPLYSAIRGNQQALANGNVLIVESNGSRLLEVNRQGELVWEYYSPVRGKDKGSERVYAPVFMSARRYQVSELPFLAPDP